jgi:hypothetical protein
VTEQTVLPFKLETTMDLITAHAGLALLGEFAVGVELNKALGKDLPGPGLAHCRQENLHNPLSPVGASKCKLW